MPTTQNVDRIIKDFTNHKQYAAAHLFFTEGKALRSVLPCCVNVVGVNRTLRTAV